MSSFTRRTGVARLGSFLRARPIIWSALALGGILAAQWGAALGQGDARDSAAPESPPTTSSSSPTLDDYQTYTLQHINAREIEKPLAKILADLNDGSHLVSDPRGNRIFLRGPETTQRIARGLIAAMDRPGIAAAARTSSDEQTAIPFPAGSSALNPPDANPQDHLPAKRFVRRSEIHERTITLQNARADRVEQLCRELFGDRLRPQANVSPDRFGYLVANSAGLEAELSFDRRQNAIVVRGPNPLLGQLSLLVLTLDSPPQDAGKKIRVVPLRRADPRKVQQAIEAYRQGHRAPADPQNEATQPEGQTSIPRERTLTHAVGNFPANDTGPSGQYRRGMIQQSAFQQEAAGDAGGNAPGDVSLDDARRRLRELGADVEIETLDDLDVIILRGNNRDVEEVSRIIREIERLSVETAPAVEVVPLKHVGSDALAELLNKVNADLVGGRQGRVSVMSLVKPNALLLVGWGEAVTALKELIAKLDQPVEADSEFRVFRLKHAPAGIAATNLQTFFNGRTGLGTRVRVTPDPRTNALLVQAAPRDMQEIEKLIERIDTPDSGSVQQARVIQLKHALAADVAATLTAAIEAARGGPGAGAAAAKSSVLEFLTVDAQGQRILKSGVLSDVRITPDTQRNSLIIAAPAESMELLEALIRQLDDAPTAAAQIKVFRVVNGDATALAQMLRALLPTQPGNTGPQLSSASGETSLAPLRFAVDLRTNSIIASGSTGDLRIIEALLLRLDEKESQTRKNAVYRLKNAPALDVARAINDFLRSERQVQQAAPGSLSPFLQIESEVVVVPEPVSNSLILSATPRFFDEISDLVERLDAQPPQVMIQVLIAEVTLNNADEFGVELGLQDSLLFDRSLLGDLVTTTNTSQTSTAAGILTNTDQVIQAATNTPGFNFNGSPLPGLGNSGSEKALGTAGTVAGQALSNFSTGRINNELGFGGLVLSASSESVSVLIRALQESRRLEVLSRPEVMTLDNQPAFIQVGQRVPRIVGSTINQLGQINTIELENVGLILAVTPRISPDGMVVMEIDAEKSDVGPEIEGIPVSVSTDGTVIRSPRINLTTAQTTVSASSGETIVLGGLITKSSSQTHRRVPWLGDLPLLGSLFRYDNMFVKRSELLIIMTPHVVRSPEDVEKIKQLEAARMHWCCADVHELHGDGGLCHDANCPICNAEIPTIYPDINPRGLTPSKPAAPPEPGLKGDISPASPSQNHSPVREQPVEQQPDSGTGPAANATGTPGPYIPQFDESAPPTDVESLDAVKAGRSESIQQTNHSESVDRSKREPPTSGPSSSAGKKQSDPNRVAKFPFGWRK